MRSLTFKGYLTKYMQSLSLHDSKGVYALAREAANENPRLREPLFLYALFTDKSDVLMRASKGTKMYGEYRQMMVLLTAHEAERLLETMNETLPSSYTKVYRSYLSVRDRVKNDAHTKMLMHKRTVDLLQEKLITSYRVYKDLSLNPGNVNAYLKHGDVSKLSLDTARRVLKYAESK